MHHIKPTSKGDPLCPLGFHPQVRWPTRCKRCFRDYKEHGNRNKDQDIQLRRDELTVSTPALSSYSSSRLRDDNIPGNTIGTRTWTSSSNLSSTSSSIKKPVEEAVSSASSWTSSPNLAEQKDDNIVVSFTLPKRKSREPEPIKEEEDYRRTQYTVRRRTSGGSIAPTPSNESPRSSIISTPTTRSSPYRSVPQTETTPQSNSEVDFIFHVKSSNKNQSSTTQGRDVTKPFSEEKSPKKSSDESSSDDESVANTETTETTIINPHEQQLQEEIDNLKRELEIVKVRCERAEREKSDILLRRLASMETTTSKTTASEVLKLQQKCNELRTNVEDLRDEKKVLSLRVRELETDLEISKKQSTQKETEQLRSKLQAAETLCEELMEENEDMKRELKNMEEEMIEMHDNFREDQADEYSSMKKELEQTTKNCRILSFKLRKAERKAEQLDAEKLEAERKLREIAGGQAGLDKAERIRQLEHDLSVANEAASRLQKELEEAKSKTKKSDKDQPVVKKKAPMLGSLPKTPSGERMSRESLTRGGSQEDPVQLLRDLQDSLEREADLREQLRQAEDEAQNLRKKASRVEDDNESLVLQLKKMATKARTRRHSPSPQRLTPEPVEKDEGISDEEDPAELRILLELNEQEAAVLRRKVEDLESESDGLKKKVKDLQDKLATKETPAKKSILKNSAEPVKANAIYEQKMKVLEEEMSDLRKKLIEKDRECERLHTELSLGVKKPKVLQKSRSLDGDQQTVDLKRQLQVVETEASVLRTRIQNLETENEKLQAENKKLSLVKATKRASSVERGSEEEKSKIAILEKQLEESRSKIKELEKTSGGTKNTTVPVGEIEKLKTQLKKVETEKKKFEESLKRVKDDAIEDIINYYHKRTPKTPTDMTTKLQMKKMVEEVESELGELLAILKKSENEKKSLAQGNKNEVETKKLKEELETSKKKLETVEKELKEQEAKKQSEIETLSNSSKKLEEEKVKYKKEVDKLKQQLEKEKQKLMESKNEMEHSKKSSSTEVDKLKEEIKKARGGQEEASILKKKLETATVELQEQKRLIEELNKKLEETKKDGAEKKKLLDQVEEKENAYMEMEKKAKDFEEKLKKSEKLLHMKKEKLTKLEKEKEEINGKVSELEKDKLALAEDQRELTRRFNEAEQKIEELKKELTNKAAEMKKLEDTEDFGEKSKKKDVDNAGKTTSNEIAQLQGDLKTAKTKIQELTDQIAKAEREYSSTKETMRSKEKELEKEVGTWEKKASELEMDLQVKSEELGAERKMMERLKGTQEKEIKAKDLEIAQLRAKTHTAGAKKLSELKQEMQAKIDKLELAVASEKHEYDELTSKYEQLEEEHVITKAQLVKDKEKLHSQLLTSQRDFVEVEAELKALRETFNTKQDTWIIEKLNMQEKLKENENHIEKWQLEKTRLQAICDERQSELEQVRKESQGLNEQNDFMRKENEELRKQIEDFEKVSKIQRNMNADVSALEKQVKEYKVKLTSEEKARKADTSSMKLRYENQVSVISDELLNTQKQMARFKKERDSYRHMMEAAQKTITELKSVGSHINQSNRNSYEGEDLKDHIAALEQQVSCLEDELSESRVEASQLRTELVSERSAWEVKVSELSSRLNELEEEKILSSGRTKISGLKTKMELAWQKEREEQHRLLQETSTLARDLRQTLFEVERERDKERLEARRKLEQQKRGSEEEQEEIRKKLNDMHCDLLELRDAHAKLRTTNEKLRREKEKMDKDREMLRQSLAIKKKMEQEEERRIIGVAQLVEELTVLAPDLFPSKPKLPAGMPTPPVRRKGPKSREASPLLERKDYSRESSVGRDDIKSQEVQEILVRLTEAANQLRKYQLSDREAARAAFASRRAASTESDRGSEPATRREHGKQKSLLRKSLSLEQTSAQEQMMIWKMEDDKDGSLPSIQSLDDMDQYQLIHRRDPSLDSRLSGGSTRSEVLPTEKKKKTSLFGKLKKLTKSSRSMDQSLDMGSDAGSSGALDRGSDSSLNAVDEKAGRHFKLSGMFKKSGSTSRGNSLERNLKPPTGLPMDSTQRPLVNSSVASNAESTSSSRSASKKPPSSAPIQRKMKK